MSWLGRVIGAGSRFLAKAAPVASYLARTAPSALNTVSRIASNPLVNQLATKIGVNPNVMRGISMGASNVGAGLNLVPGVVNDVRQGYQSAMAASDPARKSLAQLYRTSMG